jgi:chitinase
MKLQRRGASVTAYQSLDGWRWFPAGTATLDLPTIYVGLAVTSRNTTATATALFDHIVIGAPNSFPVVELTAPDDQATFAEPATVEIRADAIDDNAVAQVNFYAGSMQIGSSTTPPYTVTWDGVPAGTHSLRAVAFDYNHTLAISAARTILVTPGLGTYLAAFVPSSNHDQAVTNYVLDIYEEGTDPSGGTPVATAALGKPVVVDGECRVDITSTVGSLPPGSFIATVTALGPGGSARSDASPPFVR